MNIFNLLKLATKLDKQGKYSSSDSVFKFVKAQVDDFDISRDPLGMSVPNERKDKFDEIRRRFESGEISEEQVRDLFLEMVESTPHANAGDIDNFQTRLQETGVQTFGQDRAFLERATEFADDISVSWISNLEDDAIGFFRDNGVEVDSSFEEMLSDDEESTDEEETATVTETTTATNEPQTTYRELTDEEKAQILADSIAKSTLEMALSIAETSIASTVISTTETTVTSSSRTNTSNEIETKDDEEKADTMEQQLADNGSKTANDLLETGRSLNAASLAQTQTQTEQSAGGSILQAESIAISSSEIRGSDTIIESISIENVLDNSSVANSGSSDSETNIEPTVSTTETVVEEVLVSNIEQSIETSSETVDSFNDIMNIEIKPTDTTLDDVEFVQNVLAQSEQKSEENISAFEEDEKVTIQNDPNLANAFNVVPNTTNLELAGVLGNNKDEKSDAEKRSEEVVAANKEQQDEINKNYMDADQSGIVAAMGSDTDVSSYRSAMLNDNNIWYKPEDIYKNVVYKDNVRGAYFLEKGNTDTYKKMVEEQYK